MPSFHERTHSQAPPEEVWELLYDSARFPDWWQGFGSVEPGEGGEYAMYPEGYPDFPMARRVESHRAEGRVTVSCLVSDRSFHWLLEAADEGTTITVDVEIPEEEAERLDAQREAIHQSLQRLAGPAAVTAYGPSDRLPAR